MPDLALANSELAKDILTTLHNMPPPVAIALLRPEVVGVDESGRNIYRLIYLTESPSWSKRYSIDGPLTGRCHYDIFPGLPEEWKEDHRQVIEIGRPIAEDDGAWFTNANMDPPRRLCLTYAIGVLPPRDGLHGLIFLSIDITGQKLLEKELERRANRDQLTGLLNRWWLDENLTGFLHSSESAAMLYLDLNLFKEVNDRYGHGVGDQVLKAVAQRLRSAARSCGGDIRSVRIGGDEFALLLPHGDIARSLAARVVSALEEPVLIEGQEPAQISASVGIVWGRTASTVDEWLSQADETMYAAKQRGRSLGRHGTIAEFDAELYQRTKEERQMGVALAHGIKDSQLFLVYQPVWDIGELGALSLNGFEALVRWRHPSMGVLLPAAFLPVAERAGLMQDITRWVFSETLRQKELWRSQFGHNIRVSVNVPPDQVESPFLEGLLNELRPHHLSVEILEDALRELSDQIKQILSIFARFHILLQLDDFGAGFSNLKQLADLGRIIDGVKLDRSLTEIVLEDGGAEVIANIVSLTRCKRFNGLTLTCEGVDIVNGTDMLPLLIDAGVNKVQGFHPKLGRPMGAAQATKLIARQMGNDAPD